MWTDYATKKMEKEQKHRSVQTSDMNTRTSGKVLVSGEHSSIGFHFFVMFI